MKRITYSRDALKTLRRMPVNLATLIIAKIERYAIDPASMANNVTALKGQPGMHRLRVQDWRILFSEDGDVLAIIKVGPRGSVYD